MGLVGHLHSCSRCRRQIELCTHWHRRSCCSFRAGSLLARRSISWYAAPLDFETCKTRGAALCHPSSQRQGDGRGRAEEVWSHPGGPPSVFTMPWEVGWHLIQLVLQRGAPFCQHLEPDLVLVHPVIRCRRLLQFVTARQRGQRICKSAITRRASGHTLQQALAQNLIIRTQP